VSEWRYLSSIVSLSRIDIVTLTRDREEGNRSEIGLTKRFGGGRPIRCRLGEADVSFVYGDSKTGRVLRFFFSSSRRERDESSATRPCKYAVAKVPSARTRAEHRAALLAMLYAELHLVYANGFAIKLREYDFVIVSQLYLKTLRYM